MFDHQIDLQACNISAPLILRQNDTSMRTAVLLASLSFRFARAMSTTTTASTTNLSRSSPARAAVAQLTSTSSKQSNLMNIAQCAALAKKHGACMLFLPECFGFMGSSATETLENAEVLEEEDDNGSTNDDRRNDPQFTALLNSLVSDHAINPIQVSPEQIDNASISIMDGLRSIAKASKLWISGGGIHEYMDGERVYNTHVIVNDEGELICKYRKIHLFDVSIPDRGIELKESKTTKAGDGFVLCDSPVGVLGLSTCYDMRFPEQYMELLNQGAQIMLMPSAFTVPTGQAHWHILLRARAIETQCYVLAAAQVGRHNEKRESYGHAIAVNPWGDVLADAELESPTVVLCDIDLDYQAEVRLRMPIQTHRATALCE